MEVWVLGVRLGPWKWACGQGSREAGQSELGTAKSGHVNSWVGQVFSWKWAQPEVGMRTGVSACDQSEVVTA